MGTVLLLVLALRLTVVSPMAVGGVSMEPTVRRDDIVLVTDLPLPGTAVERGDLVVFEQRAGELSLKRVLGLPGERVAIRDGALEVDGRLVVEPYVDRARVDALYFGPVTVPGGSYFLLGDNRDESVDSRDVGAVPADRLVGRVLLRVWRTPW